VDVAALATALVNAQAGQLQLAVASQIMHTDFAAQKSSVMTLLDAGQQGGSSLANVGAGIGTSLNINA
jgi:hypothetical protein